MERPDSHFLQRPDVCPVTPGNREAPNKQGHAHPTPDTAHQRRAAGSRRAESFFRMFGRRAGVCSSLQLHRNLAEAAEAAARRCCRFLGNESAGVRRVSLRRASEELAAPRGRPRSLGASAQSSEFSPR